MRRSHHPAFWQGSQRPEGSSPPFFKPCWLPRVPCWDEQLYGLCMADLITWFFTGLTNFPFFLQSMALG